MTGKGHRLTGLGTAFIAATLAKYAGLDEVLQILTGAIASISTTIPDWIEIPYYRKGVRAGSLIKHRTITHWPWLWLGLMIWGCTFNGIEACILIGASCGALAHILADAPNPMGIPWIHPAQRIRFGKKGLWRSGEYETLIVSLFTLIGAGIWLIGNSETEAAQTVFKVAQAGIQQAALWIKSLLQ